MRPGTSPNARPPSRSDRSTLNRSPARSCSRGWQLPASEAWRLPCTGAGTRSVGLRKRRARRSRRTMGPDPTRAVLPILIGIVLLSAAWSAVSSVAASSDGGHPRTSAVAGGGTHEIIPDPRRPLIYQVGVGDNLLFLNASTGAYIDLLPVGPSLTSIDLSADGNFLYVAVSGANATVVVDIDARSVVRTINLGFSPLSVRHGRPDRLYVSGTGRRLRAGRQRDDRFDDNNVVASRTVRSPPRSEPEWLRAARLPPSVPGRNGPVLRAGGQSGPAREYERLPRGAWPSHRGQGRADRIPQFDGSVRS